MNSPVLFIIFNRPDTTKEVFEAIKKAKPSRLYIAADGPRAHKPNEEDLCAETRNVTLNIDWPCTVLTCFQEKNLGCKLGVSTAINWFFEHEEEGIILEDDVVPHPDFFQYCDLMLEKYRYDERVMMVTGTNYLSNANLEQPYFFSEHFTIWGWATWRRAWSLYDIDINAWDRSNIKENIRYKFNNNYIWRHFRDTFNSLKSTYIDTWDIQWVFTCITNNGLCVTPKVNLITNIGVDGAHSNVVTDSHFIKTESLNLDSLPSQDPLVIANASYDQTLHMLKTKPAQKAKLTSKVIRSTGVFWVARKVRNFLRKLK